jgi:hypothetical protein
MEISESSDDTTRDAGAGDRSYSEEASSEYSESPKSSEGGLGGCLCFVRMVGPSPATLASAHGRAEGGEVKRKEKANDQGRVNKVVEGDELFKEAEG